MNYEEMLNSREGTAMNKERLAIGTFYRKRAERRLHHVVELRPELAANAGFCSGLDNDRQMAMESREKFLLHFDLHEDSSGVYELELTDGGNYMTLSQLLKNTPAVVAERGFIDGMVADLMTILQKLHDRGVCQVSLAPEEIFLRKGDHSPMLLCHGSSLSRFDDMKSLYRGFEDCVAPEVLEGGETDVRSDVWALGALVKKLYDNGDLPVEYRKVVKKAMADDPAQRYQTIEEMRQALARKKGMKRTAIVALAALAVAALAVFLFFDLMPQNSNVEFIDDNGLVPVDHYADDIYDEPINYDPLEYMDPYQREMLDSMGVMSGEELEALLDSVVPIANAQEIFRRQFEREAQTMLTQLYSREQMGSSQNDFIARSQSVMDELMESARRLGEQCDMDDDQATTLAGQIIARIQAEKQRNITRYGSMTESQDE